MNGVLFCAFLGLEKYTIRKLRKVERSLKLGHVGRATNGCLHLSSPTGGGWRNKEIMKIIIDVLRHGNKNGDELTRLGEDQVTASAKVLTMAPFQRIVYSGTNRTWQSGCIVQLIAGFSGRPEEDVGFNFANLISPDKRAATMAEIAQIQKDGDTVELALQVSEYARAGRNQLTGALLELAADMAAKNQTRAIVCSHSPYTELAVPNPADFPYGLNEASWIRYVVEDGQIISATLNHCPIPGGRN